MGKSATVLGRNYGLTAQEMNHILAELGYLDGEPGNWRVSEKGKKYGKEQDYHRGKGGYAYYNRYWTTITWDNSITDELDITEDRKKELRKAISIAKQKIKESRDDDIILELDSDNSDDSDMTDAKNKVLVASVIVLLVAVSSYGVYKAAPYIKRWWNDKAIPRIKKNRRRITIGAIIATILAFFLPSAFRKK